MTGPLCLAFMGVFVGVGVLVEGMMGWWWVRVGAYVAVWGMGMFGMFFVVAFGDYVVGWEMLVLLFGECSPFSWVLSVVYEGRVLKIELCGC